MSMLSHAYNTIIDRSVGEPRHGREFVGDLNATDKRSLSMLMTKLKLPGTAEYDSNIAMYTSTLNIDIIIARQFQKIISDSTYKNGVIDKVNDKKLPSKLKWTYIEYHVQDIKDV